MLIKCCQGMLTERCTSSQTNEVANNEPRVFRVDDDVPAEQNAAYDLPDMQARVVRPMAAD